MSRIAAGALLDGAGVVAAAQQSARMLDEDSLRVRVGERAFQSVADLDARVPAVDEEKEDGPVVSLRLADAPRSGWPRRPSPRASCLRESFRST